MQNKNDNLIIEMKDISKFFPGTRALDEIAVIKAYRSGYLQ